MFVPQKSIFEHLGGSNAAALFSLMVALVMLVLSIGGLFFSMRAMRIGRQEKHFTNGSNRRRSRA
jgi:hypothetical protein